MNDTMGGCFELVLDRCHLLLKITSPNYYKNLCLVFYYTIIALPVYIIRIILNVCFIL